MAMCRYVNGSVLSLLEKKPALNYTRESDLTPLMITPMDAILNPHLKLSGFESPVDFYSVYSSKQ